MKKAIYIYIPIRRLNNIFVDYVFHYKYMCILCFYIEGKKGAPRRARKVLVFVTKRRFIEVRSEPTPILKRSNQTQLNVWSAKLKTGSESSIVINVLL